MTVAALPAFDPTRTYPRKFVPADADLGEWAQIEPLYKTLLARTPGSTQELRQWLDDYYELSAAVGEEGSRRYINMTLQTDDPAREAAFQHFVTEIEPRIKPLDEAIDKAYFNNPHRLELPRGEYALMDRMVENHIKLFREENIPLETQDQLLGADYQKVIGAMTIEMEGKETDLDKTIIEAIKDPLTHIVRNSVDHGIETPARRAELGKPPAGRLHMRAFHESGQVVIEITDDGGGIDVTKVRRKAVEKGLFTPDHAARLTDRQALEIIFQPGFSTAEKTTNVSGRGVGMDVVKTNIENIGGTLDLQNRPGQGTTLRLRIPLTLAIIPALLVSCGGEKFAIPQTGLVELVRLDGDQESAQIEMIYGAPVVRLRGKLLPLVFLGSELKLAAPPGANGNGNGATHHAVNIIVLHAESHTYGVVVDEVHDTEEIVVKPLGRLLKGLACFAGGTILGDGREIGRAHV